MNKSSKKYNENLQLKDRLTILNKGLLGIFNMLPKDILIMIYTFNPDHRVLFRNSLEEIENTKNFRIGFSPMYMRITDYAVMWKKKSCLTNNHFIILNNNTNGIIGNCETCGTGQGFSKRGLPISYLHLSMENRLRYNAYQPFDWCIKIKLN